VLFLFDIWFFSIGTEHNHKVVVILCVHIPSLEPKVPDPPLPAKLGLSLYALLEPYDGVAHGSVDGEADSSGEVYIHVYDH
jgi:hypothetical protein